MPVDPHDDVVPGRTDTGVQAGRRAAGGVGHHPHARVGGGQVVGDPLGAVGGRAHGEHDLELAAVLLAEDLLDALDQVRASLRTGITTETGGQFSWGARSGSTSGASSGSAFIAPGLYVRRYNNLFVAAQRVSSLRFDSCSLRSTFDAWVSTVFTEMNSRGRSPCRCSRGRAAA